MPETGKSSVGHSEFVICRCLFDFKDLIEVSLGRHCMIKCLAHKIPELGQAGQEENWCRCKRSSFARRPDDR